MRNDRKLKVMFAGLGSIGQRHLRNLLALRKGTVEVTAWRQTRTAPILNDGLSVVAREDVSAHYGIVAYDKLDAALAENPDVVFVTNPTRFHAEVAYRALLRGCHVFVEKPLADSWDRVDDLIRSARDKRLVAAVGFQSRFHPGLQLIKRWLDDGLIGNLISAEFVNGEHIRDWHKYEDFRVSYAARRELGGGALLTQCHEFDIVFWLLGRPSRLFAVGGQLSNLEIDVEDSVSILMDVTRDGRSLPVTVHLDYLQSPPVRRCIIVGDQGRITWDDKQGFVRLDLLKAEGSREQRFDNFVRNDLFVAEMKDFLDAIEKGREPEVGLQCASESLAMVLAARQSMTSRQALDSSQMERLCERGRDLSVQAT